MKRWLPKTNETGNARTKFGFFKEMHQILFKDPKVTPIYTVSSLKVKTRSILEDEVNEESTTSAQRKKAKFSRDEIEERTEKTWRKVSGSRLTSRKSRLL